MSNSIPPKRLHWPKPRAACSRTDIPAAFRTSRLSRTASSTRWPRAGWFQLHAPASSIAAAHERLCADRKTLVDVAQSVDEYLEQRDWRVNANANQGYSLGGLNLNVSGKVVANYWLSHVYGYCHNPQLMPAHGQDQHDFAQILDWLASRRGLLDAVVFSRPGIGRRLRGQDHRPSGGNVALPATFRREA